jgi:hypothetical protein
MTWHKKILQVKEISSRKHFRASRHRPSILEAFRSFVTPNSWRRSRPFSRQYRATLLVGARPCTAPRHATSPHSRAPVLSYSAAWSTGNHCAVAIRARSQAQAPETRDRGDTAVRFILVVCFCFRYIETPYALTGRGGIAGRKSEYLCGTNSIP